jgi:nucleoside 2-deoxyribosyltransferase
MLEALSEPNKKLYLAAPLFSSAELSFNSHLKNVLSPYFNIYLPQEDGELMINLVTQGMPPKLAAKRIFSDDIEALKESDIFLIVLDGRSVDEGAAFELGLAYALGKKCIGLKTDTRSLLWTGNNPMIDTALSSIFKTVDDLVNWANTERQV